MNLSHRPKCTVTTNPYRHVLITITKWHYQFSHGLVYSWMLPLWRGHICHDITLGTTMTMAEHKSNFTLTKNTLSGFFLGIGNHHSHKISLCPNSMVQIGQNVLDKKCLILPYYFKIDSETTLKYTSIGPFITHSVLYILGGPIAYFIP